MAVVRVMVSTPTLVITEVSPSNINLLTRETTVVTVSVSAIGNHDSTLKATVTGTGNSVTPTEITGVRAGTPTTFTVTAGLDAGDETLTLTASHPDYDSTSTKVDVRVDLRPIELSVMPSPLEVVIGTSKILTIGVSATEGVTLTVTVDRDDRIEELAAEYLLTSGETSTEISVRGDNIGDTTLTIEAEAEGYTSATTTVSVEVLDSLRIVTDPLGTFDLEEGSTQAISVSLSRIEAGRENVMVTIKPEGIGLTVIPASLMLSDTTSRIVTVMVDEDTEYNPGRSGMLTLTADDYTTATVTVMILEDDLPVEVRITTLEGQASTTISEADGNVMLRLTLSRPIGQNLQVNLSYMGDSGLATGAPSNVVVPASSMSQSFSISVDDDIAAQATRTFNVLIEPDSSYAVGTSSSVTVSVLNDDTAVVSILPPPDSIDEGDTAEFEVQVSNEIATTLTVTINLTAGSSEEDFGINLDDVDVEIAAGETTALLTVDTTGDDIKRSEWFFDRGYRYEFA